MRVLVHTHRLEVGGTQQISADLAAAMRDRGHEVTVYAAPGPAVELLRRRDLPYVAAPESNDHPTTASIAALRRQLEREPVDLVHAYEWPQCLTAHRALATLGVPVLFSVLAMAVPRWMPRSVPLIVGSEQIRDVTAEWWRAPVHVVEPAAPDTATLGEQDVAAFAERYGLADRERHIDVVLVSRLAEDWKLESAQEAVRVVAALSDRFPMRLIIVGHGPGSTKLRELAASANGSAGREVIVLTGELVDPAPAFAVADIVLGMGLSAVSAMAYGKPVIVLGTGRQVQVLDESSLPGFLWHGFIAVASGGTTSGAVESSITQHSRGGLAIALGGLAENPTRRAQLGEMGMATVRDHFSLDLLSDRLERIYESSRRRDMVGRWDNVYESARSRTRRAISDTVAPAVRDRLHILGNGSR